MLLTVQRITRYLFGSEGGLVTFQDMYKILVIDEDREIGNLLQYALGSQGYEIVLCADPQEAFLLLSQEKFDYIITEYRFPGMNGLEFVRQLRQQLPPLTVIIGVSTQDLGREFLEGGANDFLRKPFIPYTIAMMIDGSDLPS
mgnify:CR=1 FL=1